LLKYVFIFLFSFFTLEALVRWKIHYDEDGQSYFFHIPLMPYVLPVKSYLKAAQNWTGAKFENSYLAPSSKLGWDIRPNSLSQNKLYFANLAGQRSSPKSLTKKKKLKKNIRLAIFGGSFLHGDEVSFEESLAALLEKQVPEIEIINFAVPSYGLDQSYLKYLEIKQKEKLDWVVIGIYPAMCERNLNILRNLKIEILKYIFPNLVFFMSILNGNW